MMKEMKAGAYILNDKYYDFNFVTNLSAADKLNFVNSVVDLIVDENSYNSIIRDIIFDFYIVDIMTDVDTTELKKSLTFLNDVEDFLFSTNIVEIVRANAFPTIFDELNIAVDKSIQYLTGIHPSPISDSIASLVSAIEKKINDIDTSSMMEMANVFSRMTGEITPESIVNAYLSSDIYKKNLNETVEVKNDKTVKKGKTKTKGN